MELHVDLSWILEIAQRAGQSDPAPEDFGVPVAAVARHQAELLDTPDYGGPYARAAALTHTLGRCRWLERSNLTVACAAAAMYLAASGIDVQPDKQHLRARRGAVRPPQHRRPRCRTAAHLADLSHERTTGGRWLDRACRATLCRRSRAHAAYLQR
jgi:hypothetical protein